MGLIFNKKTVKNSTANINPYMFQLPWQFSFLKTKMAKIWLKHVRVNNSIILNICVLCCYINQKTQCTIKVLKINLVFFFLSKMDLDFLVLHQ